MRAGGSSTKPNLTELAGSRCRVPLHADLLHIPRRAPPPEGPGAGCLTRRRPSRMAATPERSSAARDRGAVGDDLSILTRGLMPKPFWTWSTWAASRTGASVCPPSTAIRFPAVPSTLTRCRPPGRYSPGPPASPSARPPWRAPDGRTGPISASSMNSFYNGTAMLLLLVCYGIPTLRHMRPSQNVLPWTPCGIATGVPIFGPSAETIANTGLSVPEHGLADVTGV